MRKINSEYLNPNGTWMVTTEGDCEGKTTKTLGVFIGRLDEIAFALAPKAYYKLMFQRIDTAIPTPTEMENEVTVALTEESGTSDLSPDERLDFFNEMLKETDNVFVSESSLYNAVILNRIDLHEKERRNIRKAALAKLTPTEKAVLGLGD